MLRALLLSAFLLVVLAPSAGAEVRWLCSPALPADPCRGDLTTRVFAPDGSSRVERVAVPARPEVDCFYVYPTTSNQPTPNATQTADPEIRSIATYQAQRFSSKCRVFAPLYRQVTAAGVTLAGQTRDAGGYTTAFEDVREAFKQYLREDNGGRGFILVGHSQGSRILRALIRRDIDAVPDVRRRMVSALIPGANVTVAPGKRVGGDFANVPACDEPGQTGCVISYHTFNETPPANRRFGSTETDPVGGALDLPTGKGPEVLCTDPAALSGAPLDTLVPSEPFAPGVIASLLVQVYGGPPPTADTPWLTPADRYTSRCETVSGADVLRITPAGPVRKLTPAPDATWGVHLVDVNLPLGNLLRIADAQTAAYLGTMRATTVRLGAVRTGPRRRQLVAAVLGRAGADVRVSLLRGGHFVTRRTLSLNSAGVGRVRFRIGRAGSYSVTVRDAAGRVTRSGVRRITLR